jgi:hypothetical protein
VKTTVVIPPNGQLVLAIVSAEGQEDTISASRAEMVELAGVAPPVPRDLADALRYTKDTIDVSPDGKRLTYFGGINQLKQWTVGSGAPAEARTATEDCYNERAISRDASTVVCKGFDDDPMRVWDLAENRVVEKVPMAEGESVYIMALSEDGSVLAKALGGDLRVVPLRQRRSIKNQTVSLAGRIAALGLQPFRQTARRGARHGTPARLEPCRPGTRARGELRSG